MCGYFEYRLSPINLENINNVLGKADQIRAIPEFDASEDLAILKMAKDNIDCDDCYDNFEIVVTAYRNICDIIQCDNFVRTEKKEHIIAGKTYKLPPGKKMPEGIVTIDTMDTGHRLYKDAFLNHGIHGVNASKYSDDGCGSCHDILPGDIIGPYKKYSSKQDQHNACTKSCHVKPEVQKLPSNPPTRYPWKCGTCHK